MTYEWGTWIPASAEMACCTLSGAQDRRVRLPRPSYGRPRNDMEEEGGLETRPTLTTTGSAVG